MEPVLPSLVAILWICFQIFLLWLSADFVTGAVHWWQDAYGNPTWPLIGKYVIEPNLKHHKKPRAMLEISYWNRVWTSVVMGILILFFCWICSVLSWQIIVGTLFATQGNEIHAMGHRTDKENGKFVIRLQKIGIIQRRRTHGWHHRAPYDTNFCVMTEFLNPILNKIDFWKKLEICIEKIFRIKSIRGAAIRGGV